MQFSSRGKMERSLRTDRMNTNFSQVVSPSRLVYAPASERKRWPLSSAGKRVPVLRRTLLLLLCSGLLLSCCFWLLFPLLDEASPASPTARVLLGSFPWLTRLFWTRQFPVMVALVSSVPWFNLRSGSPIAAANLALLLLGIAFALVLFIARSCQRATRYLRKESALFLLFFLSLFTLVFGAFFLLLPGALSQEALLSGLYGHLLLVEHVNPYLLTHASNLLAHDALSRALTPGTFVTPRTGPLWLDMTVPLAWLARDDAALILLVFRSAGLFLHLLNALLLWGVLVKLRPERCLAGTLLYAWNPVLLLGVGEVQSILATIFCFLLGVFLLQRRSLLTGWLFLLLSALVNPFILLVLPLFLRVLFLETRRLARGRRVFWWLACMLLSASVVALTSVLYWPGLSVDGVLLFLRGLFWPDTARDSLVTALNNLPFASWPPAVWLLVPRHWLILPAVVVGALLLLGIWIAETLELALLIGSWIFLVLVLLFPLSTPWLVLIPLTLSLASASRRTASLAHLLTLGALVAYGLDYWPARWSGQALVVLGLPALLWGWMLFFVSTWQITQHENEDMTPRTRARGRLGLSRPSWPSRPAAWRSRSLTRFER